MPRIVFLLPLLLTGCAAFDNPPPEPVEDGDVVMEPWGYTRHCVREPESIFCP